MRARKIFISLLIIVVLGAGIYAGSRLSFGLWEAGQRRILHNARKPSWQKLEKRIRSQIRHFRGQAGIFIKDLDSGLEFSYAKDKPFPSASLPKVPIMAACFIAAQQGKIDLGRNIELRSTDKLPGSGELKDMPAGSLFSIKKLLELMIRDSDNTAANILTGLLGIDYLNASFKSFGMEHTELSRRIADYGMRDKGIENYTTADDMAVLLEKIYRGRLGNRRISQECMETLKLTRTNDRIPRLLPAGLPVAHKTGLENGVCHDAGIVFTPKGNFLICVLTRHVNSNSGPSKRFIARISLYVYRYFEQL